MFANNQYILYNKNIPILQFHSERNSLNEVSFVCDKKISSALPYGFTDIGLWVKNRRAPKHRKHIEELLKKCGCDDLEGYIRFSYCAGLNDTFWIKPLESSLIWENVSLYRNPFDETIARIAFDGGLMGEKFTSATPELSTDGSFAKCWTRINDEIYLLKQGSDFGINSGKEPFSEMYTYQLAKEICDSPVEYNVVKHHGKISAICKLFTNEDVSYAPIAFILKNTNFENILSFYKNIGAEEKFKQMIVLDALVMNTDRHLKNFGILYNADSMKILDMAPIFDNNLALCPYASIEDLKNLEKYLPTRPCAFDIGFNELAIKCMTPEIKNKLINLQGFKFKNTSKYHLDEERLELLSNLVNYQIDNILHNRVINIPYEEPARLDDFVITLDGNSIPESIKDLLVKEQFSISDFTISDGNNEIYVKNCSFSVTEFENKIEIDIYNASLEHLDKIQDINVLQHVLVKDFDITMKDGNGIVVSPLSIDIQIGQGNVVKNFESDSKISVNYRKLEKELDNISENPASLDEYYAVDNQLSIIKSEIDSSYDLYSDTLTK